MAVKPAFIVVVIASLLAGFWTSPSNARIIIKVKTEYYTIRGTTGAKVFNSMLKRGPRVKGLKRVVALTEGRWKIGRPTIKIRGRKCVIDKITVRLFITYTFPRWRGQKAASKKLRTRWKYYLTALRIHEAVHAKLYKELTRKYEKEMRRSTGLVSRKCRNLGRDTQRKLDRLRRAYDVRHRAFDTREHQPTSRISKLERTLYQTK